MVRGESKVCVKRAYKDMSYQYQSRHCLARMCMSVVFVIDKR